MHDSSIDPSRAPWLHQKSQSNRASTEPTGGGSVHGEDDPFDPWRYWEIFSGTD